MNKIGFQYCICQLSRKLAVCFLATVIGIGLAACSNNKESDSKDILEQEGMPEYLYEGTAVVFSTMSPLMFGYFKVTGLGEGQWAASEGDGAIIAPGFSQSTFQYEVTSENTAKLSCQNYQAVSQRRYNITVYLTFETATEGTYVMNDMALGTTSSYTTKGTFEIKYAES